jgi:site-specific DNA recombinase
MRNFITNYKEAFTQEQRKQLLHLLIHQITVSENRKMDTIQIQLNKEIVKHFMFNGGENSSIVDEFSPPFTILINL